MEIFAACEQVGAGQTHIGQPCAVRAATDGDLLGGDTRICHSLLCSVDDEHDRLNFFFHIVIAVPQVQFHSAFAVFCVEEAADFFKFCLPLFKRGTVVVTDNVFQSALFHLAVHFAQVREALIAAGGFGAAVHRKQGVEFHGDVLGVDHDILGTAGVYIAAVHGDQCGGGIEILIFQLAQSATVHGVGIVGGEFFHIKAICAPSDFFIGSEADAQGGMGSLLCHQFLCGGENGGDAGLVVSTQKSGAVGDDEMLADTVRQVGVVLGG